MPTTYAIPNGSTAFAATTYTGSSSAQSITNTVNGVSFQPDLVWGKNRSNVNSHRLTDVNRGVGKVLFSDSTNGDTTGDGQLSSFNSNGWTFTSGVGEGLNQSGNNYVAWNWKAGGTPVTNTAGSITSQVSANTAAGFSVVTWSGSGAAGTIGHGLNAVPAMLITKKRTSTTDSNWVVWHRNLTGGNSITDAYYMYLNSTNGQNQSGGVFYKGTDITSTTFGFQGGNDNVNASGQNYVAYCWAAIPGYSAFGSYTGNGSTDGPFVYTGFRPRFIMFKKSSGADDWVIYDTSRNTFNVASNNLFPNGNFAEDSNVTNRSADILSNGFKIRSSGTFLNGSGSTFIWAAFGETPFAYSNAR